MYPLCFCNYSTHDRTIIIIKIVLNFVEGLLGIARFVPGFGKLTFRRIVVAFMFLRYNIFDYLDLQKKGNI